MTSSDDSLFQFDNSFVRWLRGLFEPSQAATAPAPRLLALNEQLAESLGADPDRLRTTEGVAVLVGNATPAGAQPVALAYAGHQFGGFSPRLGDGRALLLGELLDPLGSRHDLHLKGSGRTPFARGGDGKAAVGPMLREYVIGEAMHALGIPTTRALAVVATGTDCTRHHAAGGRTGQSGLQPPSRRHLPIRRDTGRPQPRSAAGRLLDRASRCDRGAGGNRYIAFFEEVVEAQASLVARWMTVGFIHGVMNTDNMTISGQTAPQ